LGDLSPAADSGVMSDTLDLGVRRLLDADGDRSIDEMLVKLN
jgi:hypothetical protein